MAWMVFCESTFLVPHFYFICCSYEAVSENMPSSCFLTALLREQIENTTSILGFSHVVKNTLIILLCYRRNPVANVRSYSIKETGFLRSESSTCSFFMTTNMRSLEEYKMLLGLLATTGMLLLVEH